MYRQCMDQLTKEDIAAAAAAHSELGPHYEGAVAESLVERIGDEIDKRVDARLGQRPVKRVRRRPDGELSPAPQATWPTAVLALGSMGIGLGATAAVLDLSRSVTANGAVSNVIGGGQVFLCVMIWIIIGVINIAYTRRH